MKKILIGALKLYQAAPLTSHAACRFRPTCSQYAIEAIERFGAAKGSLLACKRLLRCRPFGPSGYDPVPLEYPSSSVKNKKE